MARRNIPETGFPSQKLCELFLEMQKNLEAYVRELLAAEGVREQITPRSPLAAGGMQPAPKILCTRKEAAQALSISLRSVDGLIGRGELRVIRKGKRVLIPRMVLERWAKIDNPRAMRRSSTRAQQRDQHPMFREIPRKERL